jgi:hypothetical protein
MPENCVGVCPDCITQYPLHVEHHCLEEGHRKGVELVEQLLGEVEHLNREATGSGLLWLIRIAYRMRQRMSGMERYGDRARVARVACELGGELYR